MRWIRYFARRDVNFSRFSPFYMTMPELLAAADKRAADAEAKASALTTENARLRAELATARTSTAPSAPAAKPAASASMDASIGGFCRSLVSKHDRVPAVAGATTDSARATAAILAEHAELKRADAVAPVTGVARVERVMRRDSLNAAAQALGIKLP